MTGLAVSAGGLAGTTLWSQRRMKAALDTRIHLDGERPGKLQIPRRVCRHLVLAGIENSEEY